jgi:hypothetical protein
MPAAAFPGNTDVAYHAADSASPHKHARAFPPNPIERREEMLVILEVAHLIVVPGSIFL